MSYICKNPESFNGKVVGNGQCAVFVEQCSGAPIHTLWKQGRKVHGRYPLISRRGFAITVDWMEKGAAIATFIDGKYPNLDHGNHVAIYDGQDLKGIWVWDQWVGQPVHRRFINFLGGKSLSPNDGDCFFKIM